MSHIPIRSCVACRAKFPKGELSRIVRSPDGKVCFDKSGKADGRGLYWCGAKSCLDKIRKKGLVAKLLKAKESPELFDKLEEVMQDKITGCPTRIND